MTPRTPGSAGSPRPGRARPYLAPALIGVLSALAETGGEPLRQALRYDRVAIAGGEIWRLVTGHLVHLGPSHMAMNVVALGVLAYVFERLLSDTDWWLGGLSAALAIDAGLFWISTDVRWYVGLSGALHGIWAVAAVRAFQQRRPEALAFLVLLGIKLGYETWLGPVPLTHAIAAGPVVAVAHAYGAAGGLTYAVATFAIGSRRSL